MQKQIFRKIKSKELNKTDKYLDKNGMDKLKLKSFDEFLEG